MDEDLIPNIVLRNGLILNSRQYAMLIDNIKTESLMKNEFNPIPVPTTVVNPVAKYTFEFHGSEQCWYICWGDYWMPVFDAHNKWRLEEYTKNEDVRETFMTWAQTDYMTCKRHFDSKTGCDFREHWDRKPLANSACESCPSKPPKGKKGKKKMSRDFDFDYDMGETVPTSMDAKRQTFLLDSLYQTAEEKDLDLRKQFGLKDDDAPTNPKELVERIKAGKFTLPDETKRRYHYSALDGIRWRDPDLKEDQAGYEAAWNAFRKAKETAHEDIMIKDGEAGLAALRALKDWQPTGAAN